jgi:hypothetical protein
MRGFSTSRTAAITFLPPLFGYRSSPCCVLLSTAKGFQVMAVLHHSLCVCVCVCMCVWRYVNVSLMSSALWQPLPLLWSPPAQVHVSCRHHEPLQRRICVCVCVSTPEVTRRNYPSLPVLQQTATCAVIGSNNTAYKSGRKNDVFSSPDWSWITE